MAAPPQFMTSTKLFILLFTIFYSLHHFSVFPFQFEVGGIQGWIVPPLNDSKIYNDWASENRFRIGDSVRSRAQVSDFKYKKDSVMEVTEQDYKKCNSTHPIFFSNTGHTVYNLDRSGSFFFISGVSGHCERGQRMIVKVMTMEEDGGDSHSGGSGGGSSSGAAAGVSSAAGISKFVILYFVLSHVVSYLF